MSQLRQDPTTREWVILAPERAKRPQQTSNKVNHTEVLPEHDESCPFCPGNESQTPEAVLTIPDSNKSDWSLRVVPNRFAALSQEAGIDGAEDGHFNRRLPGFGIHEVIIESPLHNTSLALMSYQEVENVVMAYQQRYDALKENKQLKFITIFKNHGRESGTSLAHPHSQLVATTIITPYYHRRFDVAHDYFADFGRCLYCDMLAAEMKDGERIIAETEEFVVLEPFAPRAPFETWIVPRLHRASFGMLTDEHLRQLAIALKDTLFCLHSELDDPAFNMMIDTSTTYDEDDPYYHWHLRIVPRISMIAGFEIGSGIYISSMLPEDTAEQMRQCCISFGKEGKVCLVPSLRSL